MRRSAQRSQNTSDKAQRYSLLSAATAFAAVICMACGGQSSPTAPSQTQTPSVPLLTFTPDTRNATFDVFWLETPEPTATGGQMLVRLMANFAARFSKFRGTILFDANVLTVVSYAEGTFMQQGGAIVDSSVTGAGSNHIDIRIDRPDSLIGATGQGLILVVRFAPKTGTTTGRSALQWDGAHAYTSSFNDVLSRTFGGTIRVGN